VLGRLARMGRAISLTYAAAVNEALVEAAMTAGDLSAAQKFFAELAAQGEDCGDVPVWLAAEEKQLVEEELAHPRGVAIPPQARALKAGMVPIPFAAKPYANYEARSACSGTGPVVGVPTSRPRAGRERA